MLFSQSDIDEANELIELRLILDEFIELFKIKKSDRYIALEKEMHEILQPTSNILGRKNEDKICAIFDSMLHSENEFVLSKLHHSIESFAKEFQLECGRCDRVIYHADGVVTVAEVKAKGSRRDHAQGLGQVLMYAAAAREQRLSNDVRMALVVGGEKDIWLESACKTAGVSYINISNSVEILCEKYAIINNAILNNKIIK
jgi:hypothetical protein